MSVQLALYKASGNWINRLIRWWTGSQYSHCELVVRGTCYSSSVRDGGVRAKVMALPSDKWDVIELPWADDGSVTGWFIEHERDRYGWLDLLTGQIRAIPGVRGTETFVYLKLRTQLYNWGTR